MAEDAVARTFGGSHAEIRKTIRLIIASPVHLVRDGLAATLRCRADVIVVDVIDLGPQGIAKIANAQPDVVLVDLGQTDPTTAARVIKAVSPSAKLVAFGLDETNDHVFTCAAAGYCGYVARESGAGDLYRALVDAVEGRMHCAPHIAAAMFARLAGLLREPNPQEPLVGPVVSRERNSDTRRAGPLQQGNRASTRDQHRHSQAPLTQHSAEIAGEPPRASRRPTARFARRLSSPPLTTCRCSNPLGAPWCRQGRFGLDPLTGFTGAVVDLSI